MNNDLSGKPLPFPVSVISGLGRFGFISSQKPTWTNIKSETMSESSSDSVDEDDYEHIHMEDVPKHIEEHGLSGIEEFFKAKLENWKDVEINFGVTGDSGTGKSSFINAIRG
jgi:ribosome biogenesis GTPase A